MLRKRLESLTRGLILPVLVVYMTTVMFSETFTDWKTKSFDNVRRLDENNTEVDELSNVLVLLFMFVGLSLGVLIMQTLSHVGEAIPYTVLVFLTGIIFAAISTERHGKLLVFFHNFSKSSFFLFYLYFIFRSLF